MIYISIRGECIFYKLDRGGTNLSLGKNDKEIWTNMKEWPQTIVLSEDPEHKTTHQWSQICKEHLDLSWEVYETRILEQIHHSQFCNSTWCHTGKKKNYEGLAGKKAESINK